MMQLKRDTEYALRILYSVAGSSKEKRPRPGGLTLSEISALSGVPRVGIDRICGRLRAAALLECRKTESGEIVYMPAPDLLQKTLLDIVNVTEKGVQLFAVFDKDSAFYAANGTRLQKLQSGAERQMSLQLREFFEK